MSDTRWTPIPAAIVQPILGSGRTCELAQAKWPPWAQGDEKFQRFFIYGLRPGETIPSVTSSVEHAARLLAERFDSKDTQPLNYDWYAIIQSRSGDFYQSGPHKNVDFGHHLAQPVSLASLGISL
jgi:hypothetical protein